jgi:hypothetical protein
VEEHGTYTITHTIQAIFEVLGMLSLPALPATLVAVAAYNVAHQVFPNLTWVIVFVAGLIGLGMEALGMFSSKTVVGLWQAHKLKLADRDELGIAVVVMITYIVVVGVMVYYEDAFSGIVRAIAVATPLFSVGFYMMVGLGNSLRDRQLQHRRVLEAEWHSKEQQRLAEIDAYARRLEWEREEKVKEQDLKREQKMLSYRKKLEDAGGPKVSKMERHKLLKEMLQKHVHISPTELANRWNVSAETIRLDVLEITNGTR